MSDALRVNIYAQGQSALVRGLPKIVMERIGFPQRWNSEQHAWVVSEREVPDLCAMLENEGISPRTHDKSAPPWKQAVQGAMTPDEARAATTEMVGGFGMIQTRLIRLTAVATDFVKRKGWVALGYTSLEEYAKAELPFKLPRDMRRDLVAAMVFDGLSVRAAAAITRTSHTQVQRDVAAVSAATGTNVPVETVGRDGRETRPRRTYEPVVQPSTVWTPTEEPEAEVVQLRPGMDPCVEAVLAAFASDTITAAPSRVSLLRGACDRWLADNA